MTRELNIKIVVDNGKEEIVVTDDAGSMVALQSVMIIGGGFEDRALYCVTAGSSADLGWALGDMYRYTRLSDRLEEAHLRKAFNQMIKWIATFFGWSQGEEIDPETLLRRWADEDRRRAEAEAKDVKFFN